MNAPDFTNIKHHEDQAPMLQQNALTRQNDKAVELKLSHVNDAEGAENRQKGFDASEEGSNQYSGDGGRNRRQNNPDGQVIVKGKPTGFDFKI